MKVPVSFQRLIRNDFFVAAVVLVLFLLTNRYIYGWDDQHLEITLLKHLIDPQLYAGDYYVETLGKNFSSFLYPVLARVLTVQMIPVAYLLLYVVVRFLFFYWVYRLWQHVSGGDRLAAFCATLGLFLLGRTEELIYRTFSHQEFSYAIIFAGFYFFYRDRLVLAAFLLGLAANVHALYSLFPMMYLSVYALLFVKDRGKTFLKTAAVFLAAALPFILWHSSHALRARVPVPASEWVPLYLLSCPQVFPLGTANPADVVKSLGDVWLRLYPSVFLVLLYGAHCAVNPAFRRDRKAHVIFWLSAFMTGVCFFFAYVVPNRFVLDLNLYRMDQFVHLLLMGYTAIYLMTLARKDHPGWALFAGVLLVLAGWADTPAFISRVKHYWPVLVAVGGWAVVVFSVRRSPVAAAVKRLTLVVPLVGMFIFFAIHHYNFHRMMTQGTGFWQLQRNWEDMQYYVRDHTPKEALLLTPYDMEMGGFRIHSNRRVLVCYRDCGLIGFDYEAAREWQRRIRDVEPFRVFTKDNILPAIVNAVGKYRVDYIVFMRYYEPRGEVGFLKKMYENEIFSLYQVVRP